MKILVYRIPFVSSKDGVVEEFEVKKSARQVFSEYITQVKYTANLEEIKVSSTDTHLIYTLEAYRWGGEIWSEKNKP